MFEGPTGGENATGAGRAGTFADVKSPFWPARCGWRRLLGGSAMLLFLVAAALVPPLVLAPSRPPGPDGFDYAGVVPWAGAAVQILVTPLLLAVRRAPTVVAVGVLVVSALPMLALLGASDELFAAYVAVLVWSPVAVSGAVPALVLRTGDRRRIILVWTLVALVSVLAMRPWHPTPDTLAVGLLRSAVPALLGLYIAARIRMVQVLRERAARAEREQHLLADRARTDERARLVSQMHDVVSHRVSLMVLQAGALRMNAPDAAVRQAAEELRTTGCQALDELRDLLGVLSRPGDDGPDGPIPEPAAPPDLETLVAESTAVGAAVELTVQGDPGQAAPVIARTVHRVAQEALTNARKHAPGAPVTVRVRYDAERVRVSVGNAAAPGGGDRELAATGSGTGLAGLRRRVEVVGGTLHAGPTPDGGFEVGATMPLYVPTEKSP